MAINRKNLRVCQVLHDGTTYDVIIAVTNLDEVDGILQEWALDNDDIGEELNLPEELIYNKDITEVITSLGIDNFAYLESAISAYMDMPSYAGISGELPTFPSELVGSLYVMPELTAFLYSRPAFQGYFGEYTVPTKSFALSTGMNYIGIRFLSGAAEFIAYTVDTSFDYSSIIPVLKILNISGTLYVMCYGQVGYGLPEKLFHVMKERKMAEIMTSFTLDTSTNYVELSALTVKHGVDDIDCEAVDTNSTDNDMYLCYKDTSADWQRSAVTTINNTQYQQTAGDLGTLAGGEYVVNYIYRYMSADTKLLFSVLSNKFATLAAAKESELVDDLPDEIKDLCVLVGRIIVVQGSTSPVIQKVQKISFGTVA